MNLAEENFCIEWLGWNNDGNHDKIWGWIKLKDGRHYNFWGRRGKALRFKEHGNPYELQELVWKKKDKGYEYVSPSEYQQKLGDIIEEIKLWLTTRILEDSVMPK